MNSNINEVIRAILNFFFFRKRFQMHKKHQSSIINEVIRAF